MQVDPHLITLVESLYKNPTFAVKIKGKISEFYTQERGIGHHYGPPHCVAQVQAMVRVDARRLDAAGRLGADLEH